MRFALVIFGLLLAASNVSAEFQGFAASDFFGDCNYTALDEGSFFEIGYCSASFISPEVNFGLLIEAFYNLESVTDIVLSPLQLLLNFVRFIFHLAFRFVIVYFLWVSIGFQVMLNSISDRKLENIEKVQVSFGLMLLATLYGMVNGVGGVLW